jgi:hypothetical protein
MNPVLERDATTPRQRFTRRAWAAVAVAVVLFLVITGPRLGAFTADLRLDFDEAQGHDGGPMTVKLALTNDGTLQARLDRVIVDTGELPSPQVVVTDDGEAVDLPEMLSGGASVTVVITFEEFDCAIASTEEVNIAVRAKPFLPFQAKKDVAVHGVDGNPDGWLANATRDACD